MPANPANFRFTGVDGRGSQELVRGPQSGGIAAVRIQDPDGGSEGYTFDLTWGAGDRFNSNPVDRGGYQPLPPQREGGAFPPPREGGLRGATRYTTEQAVRVCQDAVSRQAYERFRNSHIAFRKTALDDNPGRRDWVTGLLDIRRGYDRDEVFRFSCSVNFDTGEVRSAQIDPIERDRYLPGYGDARTSSSRVAM
jgi:hypothetical protein